jgi:hypothetical protein
MGAWDAYGVDGNVSSTADVTSEVSIEARLRAHARGAVNAATMARKVIIRASLNPNRHSCMLHSSRNTERVTRTRVFLLLMRITC